jgi:hypothetical protein
MADSAVVADAPHGTAGGYERGCRCQWCRAAGEHISADGTPEPLAAAFSGRYA